jgi:hypothetical protein
MARAVLVLAATAVLSCTPAERAVRGGSAPSPLAFVDVTVVPMASERVLEHQSVVVADCRNSRNSSVRAEG